MRRKCLALLVAVLMLAGGGCLKRTSDTADGPMTFSRLHRSYERLVVTPSITDDGDEIRVDEDSLIARARTFIGTPYVYGGVTPRGFDCSGFVQWVYKKEGVTLPRTAREQSAVGERISDIEDMRAGDIVTFRHPRRGYHTGIYVGDGKFIHSPRTKDRIKISSLHDRYFQENFKGARRINGTSAMALENLRAQLQEENIQAAKQRRMADYREEQALRDVRRARSARERAAAEERDRKKESRRTEVAARDARKDAKARKDDKAAKKSSRTEVAARDARKDAKARKDDKAAKKSSRTEVAARDVRKDAKAGKDAKDAKRSSSRPEVAARDVRKDAKAGKDDKAAKKSSRTEVAARDARKDAKARKNEKDAKRSSSKAETASRDTRKDAKKDAKASRKGGDRKDDKSRANAAKGGRKQS